MLPPESAEAFFENYDPSWEDKVSFAWNGKHAQEFVDSNLEFRRQVCELFKAHKSQASLPLIAALYTAETKCAKEAWGVNRVVSELAQELLERGGIPYLETYMNGVGRGMDAGMESGRIELSPGRCQELITHCEAQLALQSLSNRSAWEFMIARFTHLSQPANKSTHSTFSKSRSKPNPFATLISRIQGFMARR